MHLKLLRAAAAVAVLGGTATLGLGTQAAMATPTTISCSTTALVTAMTGANGVTLSLSPHCTYWVTASLPTVMHSVTIIGNNANIVRTNSADPFSIFIVGCANGNLTLDNVNVSNGGGAGVDGGAIYMDPGTVTVNGGTFSNNNADYLEPNGGYGGAIYNYHGTLTVNGATFTDNNATDYGGAVYSEGTVASATFTHDMFVGNDAEWGGAIYNDDNDMTINQGNFRYNNAEYGGAIYNTYDLTVNDTLFSMNSATGEYGEGGAIYNDDETVHLNHSLIEVNHASDGGGGIYDEDGGVDVYLAFDQINGNTPDNCEPTETIDGCVG
jgi:predicted outer membrane repeat protein